jgi:hypothetical protein
MGMNQNHNSNRKNSKRTKEGIDGVVEVLVEIVVVVAAAAVLLKRNEVDVIEEETVTKEEEELVVAVVAEEVVITLLGTESKIMVVVFLTIEQIDGSAHIIEKKKIITVEI